MYVLVVIVLALFLLWCLFRSKSNFTIVHPQTPPVKSFLSKDYTHFQKNLPESSQEMCWCRPMPFEGFECETLGMKRIDCESYDLEGRSSYCCTNNSLECQEKCCSVPW